jgi:hypothetical protein
MSEELVEAVARLYADKWGVKDYLLALDVIALIRPAVLEEAATVADWPYPVSEGWGEEMAGRIAAAEDIRALIGKEQSE